jgi:hypothetical protein
MRTSLPPTDALRQGAVRVRRVRLPQRRCSEIEFHGAQTSLFHHPITDRLEQPDVVHPCHDWHALSILDDDAEALCPAHIRVNPE